MLNIFMKIAQLLQEGYTGYLVQNSKELLNLIPPRFPKIIAHHITYQFPAKPNQMPPAVDNTVDIVAEYWDDDVGIQALEVVVNGNSIRPDGKRFHITWSLDPAKGAKPVMSNVLLQNPAANKRLIQPPIPVQVQSHFFAR
jgi:hypothetical protein